jgi:hypothetical protein
MDVLLPDGTLLKGVPETISKTELDAIIQKIGLGASTSANESPIKPSAAKGSGYGGIAMGLRDAVDSGAQLLRRSVPESIGSSIDALGNRISDMGLPVSKSSGVAGVDNIVNTANQEYAQSKKLAGRQDGFDWARLSGNVLQPANYTIAKVPGIVGLSPAGMIGKSLVGGMQGMTGAALLNPVVGDDKQANFLMNKGAEAVGGFLGGTALTPVANKVGDLVGSGANYLWNKIRPESSIAKSFIEIMDNWQQTEKQMGDSGIDLSQIPGSIINKVKDQVYSSLKQGKIVDPAALIRQQDFQALGIQPLSGQLTRDPMQFALERNLRGIDTGNGANPIAQRLQDQTRQLTGLLGQKSAGAQEADVAGKNIIGGLLSADAPVKQAVSDAYGAAGDSAGRSANMDVTAFSTMANDALDSLRLGYYLPSEAREILNDISTGKIPFNVNTAVQVDSVLSAAQRTAGHGTPQFLAIGKVRDAINSAPIESTAGADAKSAFDAARKMAAQRFKTIDATPALKAALDGVAPDKFVNQFIIKADTADLNALRSLVGKDPEVMQTVRSQIAEHLRNAAFGINAAGDKPMAQEAYNKALRAFGTNKLLAFFSPEEVQQLQTIGRVGAYINSQPAAAAVNNSNTASAAMNLLSGLSGKVGGIGSMPIVNVLRDSVRTFKNERAMNKSLLGSVPSESANSIPNVITPAIPYLTPAAGGLLGFTPFGSKQ